MVHTGFMEHDTLEPLASPKEQDSAPLFVSLYIVLLAFFIMLNTIAIKDEQKMRSASQSVAQAFSYQEIKDTPEMFSEAGTELSAAQFFKEMKALAASFVPIEKQALYSMGNTMEVVLPQDFVFVKDHAELQQINLPFFEKIAEALSRWQDGLRIEAELLVSQPRSTVQLIEREEGNNLPVARTSALGLYLEKQGVHPKSIIAGLKYEDEANVTLRFNVREIGAARLNLSTPAGGRSHAP